MGPSANASADYFFFFFPLAARADFSFAGADFAPDAWPFAEGPSCLGGAGEFAAPAAEFTGAAAPFLDFSFSGFFFSSIFLGASLMPASLRNTLAWSSGLR